VIHVKLEGAPPIEFLQMPLFQKFSRVMSRLSLQTCTSNLKSVALTVLELLAFNAEKFGGHVTGDPSHAPFSKNF